MSLRTALNLASQLEPLIAEDYPRFSAAVIELSNSLKQQFRVFGTPEAEKDMLVGHFGLLGETNNTLGFIFETKLTRLRATTSESDALRDLKMTQWAHRLTERVHEESQHSRTAHNGENVFQAFHRIDHDIGVWMDKNRANMPAEDSRQIDELRQEFKACYDRLETSIEDIRLLFATQRPAFQAMPLKDLIKLDL